MERIMHCRPLGQKFRIRCNLNMQLFANQEILNKLLHTVIGSNRNGGLYNDKTVLFYVFRNLSTHSRNIIQIGGTGPAAPVSQHR